MVQPKYSPEESLERVKLMMKYDLSKTSTENMKVVSEQTTPAAGFTDPNQLSSLKKKDSLLSDVIDSQTPDKSVCRKFIDEFYTSWVKKKKIGDSELQKTKNVVQACKNHYYGKFGVLGVDGIRKTDEKLRTLMGCNTDGTGPTKNGGDQMYWLGGRC